MSHLPMNYFGALKAAVDTPFLLAFLGLFCLALTSFSYASLLDLGALRSFQQGCRRWLEIVFIFPRLGLQILFQIQFGLSYQCEIYHSNK